MSEFLTRLVQAENEHNENRDRIARLEQRLAQLELNKVTFWNFKYKLKSQIFFYHMLLISWQSSKTTATSKPAAAENNPAQNAESAEQKEKSATQLKKEAKRLEKDAKFKEKLEKQKAAAANAAPKEAKEKKEEKKEKEPTVVKYTISTPPGEKKGQIWNFIHHFLHEINQVIFHISDTTCPLPDAYSPLYVEAAWYEWWEKSGYFKPEAAVIYLLV